jgi:predicted  nucleic acid-binding Zn-ribbon protein
LEAIILNKIKEIASQDKVIQDYLKKATEENSERLKEFKREKLQINQRLTKLNEIKDKKIKWMLSHLPSKKVATEMSNEVEKLLDEIEVLKERLAEIEAKIQKIDLDGANTKIIADFLLRFIERFEKLEIGEKKLLIQAVVKRIEVYNKNKISLKLTLPVFAENERCERNPSLDSGVVSFASSLGLAARTGRQTNFTTSRTPISCETDCSPFQA